MISFWSRALNFVKLKINGSYFKYFGTVFKMFNLNFFFLLVVQRRRRRHRFTALFGITQVMKVCQVTSGPRPQQSPPNRQFRCGNILTTKSSCGWDHYTAVQKTDEITCPDGDGATET